jgi:Fe-S-cluster containining protein
MSGARGPGGVPPLDVDLLRGFGFACRPDCGLCCYAEPRVNPEEKQRLIRIVPDAEFVGRSADEFLAAAPDGGACRLLSQNRCTAHAARPHPCREFPLTAHVGTRLQATVVLSCPGVDLSALARYSPTEGGGPRLGFPTELAALRERVDTSVGKRLDASARRRRKVVRRLESDDRWVEESEVRATLGESIPLPSDADFPAEDPPSAEEGVELLPLFFDDRTSPVALSKGLGGWELLELRPEGGISNSLGVVPPPNHRPTVRADAQDTLRGYLRYWLARDGLFGTVHLRMMEASDGTVTEWVEEELRAIGAIVLSRAEVRAKVRRGETGELSRADVEAGVRATDQDLLDRESWGDRL